MRKVAHPIDVVLPDEPAAVRLMNTVWADRGGVHDALTGADDLRRFLAATGAVTAAVSGDDVAAARRLRDALRRLAATVTDDDRAPAATGLAEADAAGAVNAALAAAPPALLRRAGDGWELATGPVTAAAALGAVAREGALLVADPARPLRACHAPGCVLYFVRDHPRREWCSVACGNRVRAARHYRRRRAAP